MGRNSERVRGDTLGFHKSHLLLVLFGRITVRVNTTPPVTCCQYLSNLS